MKLTTRTVITLFNALSALNGAQRVVKVDGRDKVIEEPFDLAPKARWNAARNRGVLKPIAEAHTETVASYQKSLRAFRMKLDPSADPKVNAQLYADEVERVNLELATLDKTEHDVRELRKITATGLNLKHSPIPVTVIDDLMPLIDGDPDFEDKGQPASS